MNSASSSTHSSPLGTPTTRSRSASGAQRPEPPRAQVQAPAKASGRWRLCCPPRDGGDNQDIELSDVVAGGQGEDDSSSDSSSQRLPGARPNWRTRWDFDPGRHLKLDASGLHPHYSHIAGGAHTGEHEGQTARLLNHAKAYTQAAPTVLPRRFDAAKHVLPDGTPNIPGILSDPDLINDKAGQIEVYRWARIYVPDTCTDPKCQVMGCVSVAAPLVFMGMVAAFVLLGHYTSGGADDCGFHQLNSTQTDAFVQTVRHDFPEWANATIGNMDDWFPEVWPHYSPDIRRDALGDLIQRACASAGQTLEPVFLELMLLGMLALAG